MDYTARKISEITGAALYGDGEAAIKKIAFDSRQIFNAKGTAFLAIRTDKSSGEKYIQQAVDKGITVIISSKKTIENPDITWLITEDAVLFLQKLAKFHIQKLSLKTIGITGSNGKTVVKEWLYQCLWNKFPVVKSPKSYNSQIGLPLSLLAAEDGHQLGIFEVGISRPGEMAVSSDIFSPEIGILTHIGSAHLVNFRDEEQLILEKIKLFKNSEIIIYNADNKQVEKIIQQTYPDRKKVSFGLKTSNDLYIDSEISNRGIDLEISYFDEKFSLPAKQRDSAMLTNALCVIAVLKELGFGNDVIVEKINALHAVEMRLESAKGIRNNLIINDSYNLDLDSLQIALQSINDYQGGQKVLIITDFADIKNLEIFYPQVVEMCNGQNFEKIFLVGKEITQFESLFQAKVYTFDDTERLIHSEELKSVENSIILLKGARSFEIERVKSFLEIQKHDTVLEVNLNAILHNISVHKALLRPETKMMAMVKAYSYGLGGYEIAEFLQHHHIDYLGVAYADEGVDLRKNGITTPIMVMNPEQHSYDSIIDFGLEPEIYSFRVLDLFLAQLARKGTGERYPVHIKLETGMHRLGFKKNEIPRLAARLAESNVTVASIFSHLSTADMPEEKEYAREQLRIFREVSEELISLLGYMPMRHILNSSGITNFTDHQFDMVRIGIGMMGITSDKKIERQLQSAVTFKTVISQISEINAGDSVGYGRMFRPSEGSVIATLPVGYADGIPRMIGNGAGKVGIGGRLCPIVGNICMDMMMVDITGIDAREGEEVIIFNGNPSLQEFSDYCKTIPYEVLTSISRRVKRTYFKD